MHRVKAQMTTRLMLKILVTITASAALVGGAAANDALGMKSSCTADKNIVYHNLTAYVHDDKVGSFSYFSATRVQDAVNSCSVDSGDATATDISPNVQSFQTEAGPVIVTRKGKKFDFDFTKISLSDVCGQSSTIAAHIDLTLGSKRCTHVSNR